MTERRLSIANAEVALRMRAKYAERSRWEYLHARHYESGEAYHSPHGPAERAGRNEGKLDEVYSLFCTYGVLDADRADAIVSEVRRDTRAELDAKWLTEPEQAQEATPHA